MKGTIWWIADDIAELASWLEDWKGKPIILKKVEAHMDGSTRMDVLFELDREQANELLGYEVGVDEWLDEDDDE